MADRQAYIVWNDAKNEGVIFTDEQDARDAKNGTQRQMGSALADLWNQDSYGRDEKCKFQTVTIKE